MERQARILIIDDDPVFASAMKAVLESANYRVSSATSGDEGLERVKKEKPDLILLDIIMPTKDGFQVCEQIKGDSKIADIPVIILTSFAKDKGQTNIPVSAGLGLEAEGYLDKPVNPDKLLQMVGKLLK